MNLDTDIYEPAAIVFQYLHPKIVRGEVLIIDNYGMFSGETQAIDDYFRNRDVEIQKFPFSMTLCYIVKKY